MIVYRKANIGDIDALTGMRLAMLFDGTDRCEELKEAVGRNSKEYMVDGMQSKSFIAWVAASDDELVGMVGLALFRLPPNDWCPNGKTAYIGNMFTMPAFRGKGIASKLLSLIVDEAKSYGCERILLNTTDMGRTLYENYGFENAPTAMAYYPFGIRNSDHAFDKKGQSNT